MKIEMEVYLKKFKKDIKRKIHINDKIKLEDFCELDDDIFQTMDLNYLELKKGQRLKIKYDMGDSWNFNITVAKVIDGFTGDRRFKVISGKGYGIIDDCGGTYELYNIFIGENQDWGVYDINDFDLDAINRRIDSLI